MATTNTAPRPMIMVEDPYGYVAPSPDVMILGRSHTTRLINMGVPSFPATPITTMIKAPTIKGAWKRPGYRKPKHLIKGLRP